MAETVLVMASVDDGEADRVLNELHRRGHKAVLLDLSWFPQHARIVGQLGASGWEGHLATPYTTIRFEDIRAVYHRRCPPFEPASTMNEHERRFAMVENRFALGGILASLPTRWISHPAAMADAEYKPLQLAIAAQVGLPLPDTWIGNDPERARSFVTDQANGTVYKALMHKLVSDQSAVGLIHTNTVDVDEIDERVRAAPHQFQELIHADHDVRALVTRNGCEAVAVRAHGGKAFLDHRHHYEELRYERIHLDYDLVARSQQMLARLNLASGVFDFAVTSTGETVFYEVNPAGQWAWLEEETGAPMTTLICDALTGATT